MKSISDLRIYDYDEYYTDMDDVAKKLCDEADIDMTDSVKEYLEEALYSIKAISQNSYNNDAWRVLYNVLMTMSEYE